MIKALKAAFRQIWNMSCEDDDNTQIDPLRVGFLAGLVLYLYGGVVLIQALAHIVWASDKATDLQAFGVALGAWAAGLGAYITATGGALWMKAKGDAEK